MAYTKANYTDVDPVAESMYFLREELDCESLGITVLECEPGWNGKEHDHAEEGQEEVYLLLDGEAIITVEDEPVEMETGDALRIAPDATRRIENGEGASRIVLVGAP